MPLNTGDVKVSPPRETWGTDQYGNRVQVYEFTFQIRGQGNYTVTLLMKDFTPQLLLTAVMSKANAIVDGIDQFS